jgi:hypothetical protein
MKAEQYRPNRGDMLLGPSSMVRGMAREYDERCDAMPGLVDGWDERLCTGESAEGHSRLVCPRRRSSAFVSGECGQSRRGRDA